jgi:Na+/H+ antiporter NhaD/arsenite permease-like protein
MAFLRVFLLMLLVFTPTFAMASSEAEVHFPLWSIVFFIGLLLSIAVLPLVNSEWWGKRYGLVSLGVAIPAAVVILFTEKILLLHTLIEYVSFIILLGSLFVISGGIVIRTSARGKPLVNTVFLLIGAIFASFIGTTGASMVLIRPLIRANHHRKNKAHIFIFFIFLVSNVGGLLTPLGDPPLFLGFLRGVPFTWTFRLVPFWLFAVAILLAVFYFIDRARMKTESDDSFLEGLDDAITDRLDIRGKVNFIFLAMVIAAFFVPSKVPFLREAVMLAAAVLSLNFTSVALREENAFTYHPIIEVAILFAGIFVTMVPPMKILEASGNSLGVDVPWKFFWASGGLSSFLDNAPTYLVFSSAAKGVAAAQNITSNLIAGVPAAFLKAISVGSVFMGANSYIGNGPNFMVKAICEENGITMPSFFGYMAWSVGILVPLFIVITLVFFI